MEKMLQQLLQEVREMKQEIRDSQIITNGHFKEVNTKFEKIDDNFKEVNTKFEKVDDNFKEVNVKFGNIDDNFRAVNTSIKQLEKEMKEEFQEVNQRLDRMEVTQNEDVLTILKKIKKNTGGLTRDMVYLAGKVGEQELELNRLKS